MIERQRPDQEKPPEDLEKIVEEFICEGGLAIPLNVLIERLVEKSMDAVISLNMRGKIELMCYRSGEGKNEFFVGQKLT